MQQVNAVSLLSIEILLKEYDVSTRLNRLMLLNIYKELLDKIDLTQAASEFVKNSDHREHIFGHFYP